MVGCFAEDVPFYVDVWAGGHLREIDELQDFLDRISVEDSAAFLLPVTVAETLSRGCRNLILQFRREGDEKRSKLFHSFLREFEKALRSEANA